MRVEKRVVLAPKQALNFHSSCNPTLGDIYEIKMGKRGKHVVKRTGYEKSDKDKKVIDEIEKEEVEDSTTHHGDASSNYEVEKTLDMEVEQNDHSGAETEEEPVKAPPRKKHSKGAAAEGTHIMAVPWKSSTIDPNYVTLSSEFQSDTMEKSQSTNSKPLIFHHNFPRNGSLKSDTIMESEFQVGFRQDEFISRSSEPLHVRQPPKPTPQDLELAAQQWQDIITTKPPFVENGLYWLDHVYTLPGVDPRQALGYNENIHLPHFIPVRASAPDESSSAPPDVLPAPSISSVPMVFDFIHIVDPNSPMPRRITKKTPSTPVAKNPRKRKTEIWNFFKQENSVYICTLCKNRKTQYSGSSTTSTLRKHVATAHPEVNLADLSSLERP